MKKKIILAVLLLALLAAGIGLQAYLKHGLTGAIRKYAAPAVQEKAGVTLEVRRAGVNLLSGSALLEGVEVGNPKGFAEPTLFKMGACNLDVGLAALVRGKIAQVQNLTVKDAVITVVRNADDEKNVQKLMQAFEEKPGARGGGGKKKTGGEEPAEAEPAAGPLPRLQLASVDIRTRLDYVDHKLGQMRNALTDEGKGGPFNLALDVNIRMKDIATFGDTNQMNGSVTLKANLASDAAKCVVSMYGKVAPIIDPNRLTFDLDGTIKDVELSLFKAYLEGSDVEDGRVSGELKLVCRDGVFDPAKSSLTVTIEKLKLSEAWRRQFGGVSPEKLKMPVSIGGTLQAPAIDFKEAMKKALSDPENLMSILKAFSNQGTNAIGTNLLGGIEGSGEVQDAIGSLLGGRKNEERKSDGATNANEATDKALDEAGKGLRNLLKR